MKSNRSRRNAMLLFLLIMASTPVIAQSTHGASIVFASQTYDFDTIYQGDECIAMFTYKNTGDLPLTLFEVKSSCGCTIPSWSNIPLAPGDSLSIKVRYDSSTLGSFRKTILVKSNAINKQKTILRIKGIVVKKQK